VKHITDVIEPEAADRGPDREYEQSHDHRLHNLERSSGQEQSPVGVGVDYRHQIGREEKAAQEGNADIAEDTTSVKAVLGNTALDPSKQIRAGVEVICRVECVAEALFETHLSPPSIS
jgi:hypothetical protein